MSNASHAFLSICKALEAETLQGQVAQRMVLMAKALVQGAGVNANAMLGQLTPEGQATIRAYFA